jgi:hypothetical protein
LKNLLTIYCVAQKFLFAIIKNERKNNQYCSDLNLYYTPTKISRIKNIDSLEMVWYRVRNREQKEMCKSSGKYQQTRRSALNLHNFFRGLPTIENRMHHGTINAEEILNWVALNHALIDYAKKGSYEKAMDFLKKIKKQIVPSHGFRQDSIDYIGTQKEREREIVKFFELINLSRELRVYCIKSIAKNNPVFLSESFVLNFEKSCVE